METGHITAHLRTMAAILVAEAIAGNCRLNAQDYDFAKTLEKEIGILTDKAVKDNVFDSSRRDSVMLFVRDSVPKDSPQLRIDALKRILSEIDAEYDRAMMDADVYDIIPKELATSMLPSTLPIPDTFVDRKREKFLAQQRAVEDVKASIARSLAGAKQPNLPPVLAYIGRLLFGLGMSPNPGARPVMNGLYYQYMPGGQPLEFDESVYKDREHFDPNVYKFSKPQMQYDPYEGRHFKAGYTP